MVRRETGSAAEWLPERLAWRSLRAAAAPCRACPLWERGTQTVFGEGPGTARVVLVGEQPGHEEDLAGRPFVGPAGKLLDAALAAAGIARDETYVTNVVKHFKWEPKGRRRLHVKPNAREIGACLPWLEAEIRLLRPRALVLLGATAAQALLGRAFRVSRERGRFVESALAPLALATLHPSAVLRARTEADRRAQRELLVADLAKVRTALRKPA
jgi:uracil-DNA glycosylase family protein